MKKLFVLTAPLLALVMLVWLSQADSVSSSVPDVSAFSTPQSVPTLAVRQPETARSTTSVSVEPSDGLLIPVTLSDRRSNAPQSAPSAEAIATDAPAPPTTASTRAPTPTKVALTLDGFVASVKNGQKSLVVGVYVPNEWALKVDQQPASDPVYVSSARDFATQFALAKQFGTVGLLAHNYLGGASFAALSTERELDVVYGDGRVVRYKVSSVRHFQALSPNDAASSMLDLDNKGATLTSTETFKQVYAQLNRLVLQTCIAANGNPNWGRLFVIATPLG